MRKLLVIPIMVTYYLLIVTPFIIQLLLIFIGRTTEWIQSLANHLSIYCEDYLMKPIVGIPVYALKIMQSNKTIKWMKEASEKLKREEPINNSKDLIEL